MFGGLLRERREGDGVLGWIEGRIMFILMYIQKLPK